MPAPSSDLLWLMQLASPALPVGGFSYSEGLEAAVAHGMVHDEVSAQAWLLDQLHLVQARSELPVVSQAMNAWQQHDVRRLNQLNAWVLQTRETFETRLQTEQMGRSLLDWLRNHTEVDAARFDTCQHLPPTWPLVFALALTTRTVAPRDGLLTTAFAWAENMVQAAIKSVPLGQRSGQRILAALSAEIPAAVDHALSLHDDQRQAFSPRLAILSARHETQYSRLFRS
ncbi:MAG: urease accessory protein UreF [Betaproteobacteria bacterium]|nr:urease accessory protein UreF [Betaproteobacteria bacterium]